MDSARAPFRRRMFDRYRFYRAGLRWDMVERRAQNYGNPELPRPGAPEFEIPAGPRRQKKILRTLEDKVDLDQLTISPRGMEDAFEALQQIKAFFQAQPRFNHIKCLNWGGFGLATMMAEVGPNGQELRRLVVKLALQFGSSKARDQLDAEMNLLRELRKAEHIVQIVDLPPNAFVYDQYIMSLPMMVMDMVPNGDLDGFFVKVRDYQERLPNSVLWTFLLCLVRACIAMAWPPASIPANENNPGLITETIPDDRRDNPSRLVHFDLDSRNIFVGDVGNPAVDGEHRFGPVLKAGDFGLATHVASNRDDFYYENLRTRGKEGYFLPEQFCNDWDYIPPDSNTIRNHRIAGNYGAHSNVWGIGLILESLITLCEPAMPPVPSQCSLGVPPGKESYITYGLHLQEPDYDWVDQDLRNIVYRCQAHYPEDRPRLDSLLEGIIQLVATKTYPGETVEAIQDWLTKIMFEPGPYYDGPPRPGPAPGPGYPQGAPGTGFITGQTSIPVRNPALDVLPHPPGAMAPNGQYFPPPFGQPPHQAGGAVAPIPYTPSRLNVPMIPPQNPMGGNSFGTPAPNPINPPAANPFGPPAPNPVGSPAANPFGPQAANPFGPPAANPFGPPAPNPFGPPAGDEYDGIE
ncbi:kinase-like protein [Hypoxylon crocopeplum]|nr:kinase-like protein [Hypoxylon crocopeplum]